MKLSTYEAIVQKLHTLNLRNCLDEVQCCFPDVDITTLRSIISTEVQRNTRRTYHILMSPTVANEHYNYFKACVAAYETPGFLLRYADKQGVSPALMARLIIEKHYEGEAERPSKQDINEILRNSACIQDGALAAEVFICLVNDNIYGPLGDAMKSSIGLEYEVHLKTQLKALGLAFVDEDALRDRGYDKTPDVKLEVPIVVEGTIVTWVESKAQFGDPECHRTYSRDQYQSYWNRFGRGLVIYWFGFVDEIVGSRNEGFIIRDHMPKNVVRMEDAMAVEDDPMDNGAFSKTYDCIRVRSSSSFTPV